MALALATEMAWTQDQVGIGIYHGTLGTHLGIVFHNGQATKLVHLEWHQRLKEEDFPKRNWLATVIDLPDTLVPQVVSLLRNLCKRYATGRPDGIAYGLNLVAGRGAFRTTGAYKPGKGCDGFTCASFVAEIIRCVGLELVRLDSMQDLPRNHAWAQAILCLLNAHGATPQHVEKVRVNFRGTRLRPEEVCAAVEIPAAQRPVDQAQIVERADQIYNEVVYSCGPPPPIHPLSVSCKEAFEAALRVITKEEAEAVSPKSVEDKAGDKPAAPSLG
jgi:hypothetical protein